MEELIIHRLSNERIKDVQYIVKTVFNLHYNIDYLIHKYNRSVLGLQHCCYIGYLNDKPIAFYGAIPHLVLINGKKEIIAQTCDSYTMKEHQGKGIHKKLALASYKLMKQNGVKGVFAFHSENTFYSCKKLGWDDGFIIKRMHFKRKAIFPYFKLLCKFKMLNSLKSKRINNALKKVHEVTTIKNINQKPTEINAVFDEEYINYKNAFSNKIIELSGCKLWIKLQSIITVGTIEGLSSKNVEEVLQSLHSLMKKLGTNEVLFQIGVYDPAYDILNKKLVAKDSFRVGYLAFNDHVDFSKYRINYIESDSVL